MNVPKISHKNLPEKFLVDVDSISSLFKNTLFHGTGRFARGYFDRDKTKPNEEVVDVLKSVLENGLLPQADIIAKLVLPVEKTLSLTPQYVYARCYSERFGSSANGNGLEYVFGTYDEWWSYFMNETRKKVLRSIENILWIPKIRKNFRSRFSINEKIEFVKKCSRGKQELLNDWEMNKVSIKGNHPIVFGVVRDSITPISLPVGIDQFEVRSGDACLPSSLKFVAVPVVCLTEVQLIIKNLCLDCVVLPIESLEAFSCTVGVEKSLMFLNKEE